MRILRSLAAALALLAAPLSAPIAAKAATIDLTAEGYTIAGSYSGEAVLGIFEDIPEIGIPGFLLLSSDALSMTGFPPYGDTDFAFITEFGTSGALSSLASSLVAIDTDGGAGLMQFLFEGVTGFGTAAGLTGSAVMIAIQSKALDFTTGFPPTTTPNATYTLYTLDPISPIPVPLPATGLLLAGGMAGLGLLRRLRRGSAA